MIDCRECGGEATEEDEMPLCDRCREVIAAETWADLEIKRRKEDALIEQEM